MEADVWGLSVSSTQNAKWQYIGDSGHIGIGICLSPCRAQWNVVSFLCTQTKMARVCDTSQKITWPNHQIRFHLAVCAAYIAPLNSDSVTRILTHSHMCTHFSSFFSFCTMCTAQVRYTHTLRVYLCVCACVRGTCVSMFTSIHSYEELLLLPLLQSSIWRNTQKTPYHKSSCATFSPNNNTMENHFVQWFLFSYHAISGPSPVVYASFSASV